jgi:hypothetical protein
MKTLYSYEEFTDFIKSQPDDRQVDMSQANVNDSDQCVCLLVHFLKFVNPEHAFPIRCGSVTIRDGVSCYTVVTGGLVCKALRDNCLNYGEVKKLLTEEKK